MIIIWESIPVSIIILIYFDIQPFTFVYPCGSYELEIDIGVSSHVHNEGRE